MGLDFSRPSGQAPSLELAPTQTQEEYPQYDIVADRQQMTQVMVNSPEVDALDAFLAQAGDNIIVE